MSTTPAPSALGIVNIGQISVNVHDLPRALAFYRDVLGLRYLFTAGTLAFFDCGGVRLMLSPPETPELDHPGSILYFRVPDIQAGYQHLVKHNVSMLNPPHLIARMPDHELWMTAFHDTEGNLLQLMSEVPLAKSEVPHAK
jgi:methylmalonyl-CoA/ethylmalonyl-CoA epimerase